MPTNDEIVTSFVREFDAPVPDADKVGAYFTDDAVYHNIPMDPINGKAAIIAAVGGWKNMMLSDGWDVLHQVTSGDVVMNERVDKFTSTTGKKIALPVAGVFELRDGKIAAWRDYFDVAQFRAAFG